MSKNKKKKQASSSEYESEVVTQDQVLLDLDEEQKKLFVFFEGRMTEMIKDLQVKMAAKNTKMDEMATEIVALKKKVMILEDKLEDTEAYEKRDTVVVSGSSLPDGTESEDTSDIFTSLVKDKVGVIIKPSDISVAHRLGRKTQTQGPDRRNLIVKLCRREKKHDLMKACKTVKPPNLFINESLTRTRATALYGLRQAKKKYPDKISGYSTYDGKVYAWLKPPNPTLPHAKNSKMMVNTKERFYDLCDKTLNCNPLELVDNWSD